MLLGLIVVWGDSLSK